MTADAAENRLKKLRYRAWHRGFREADLILGAFADQHGAELAETELAAFERLLDEPDQSLYAWIIGQEQAPAEHDGAILQRLRAFRDQVAVSLSEGRGS